MKRLIFAILALSLAALGCASGTLIHPVSSSGTPVLSSGTPAINVPLETCVVSAHYLYVRSAPGREYKVTGVLRGGVVVEIRGEKHGWYDIGSGWINAYYCER